MWDQLAKSHRQRGHAIGDCGPHYLGRPFRSGSPRWRYYPTNANSTRSSRALRQAAGQKVVSPREFPRDRPRWERKSYGVSKSKLPHEVCRTAHRFAKTNDQGPTTDDGSENPWLGLSLFQLRPRCLQLLALLRIHLGVRQLQLVQGVYNCGRDYKACVPLVISGDYIPRGARTRSRGDHFLVGGHVVVPALALTHVGCGEFPILLRRFEALQKPTLLFRPGHIQKKLSNHYAVIREIPLKVLDVIKAFFPHVLAHQSVWKALILQNVGMNPHHEHLFVVRTIEYPDVPALRQALARAPEKIMIQIFRRWCFE